MKTPRNPSRQAISNVKNPLPAPEVCPNCGSPVAIVNNSTIYGAAYGEWPWAYKCAAGDCNSYVGMHPFTNIPLGTLAGAETRAARKEAKNAFNKLWMQGRMTRTEAYQWLAKKLCIPVEECHIGWSDAIQCANIVKICNKGE